MVRPRTIADERLLMALPATIGGLASRFSVSEWTLRDRMDALLAADVVVVVPIGSTKVYIEYGDRPMLHDVMV